MPASKLELSFPPRQKRNDPLEETRASQATLTTNNQLNLGNMHKVWAKLTNTDYGEGTNGNYPSRIRMNSEFTGFLRIQQRIVAYLSSRLPKEKQKIAEEERRHPKQAQWAASRRI
jgi:hypothetical protein